MAARKQERKQKTKPRGIDPNTGKPYKPVEIPVPKRKDFDKLLKRASQGSATGRRSSK